MNSGFCLLELHVRTEHDLVLARQRARQVAELIGFDLQAQTKVGTAVSEIVRNAFRYAGGGKVSFRYNDIGQRRLVIQVIDTGTGISDLDSIMKGTYTSQTGMGLGIIGTRRIMDDFIIQTTSQGTDITMSKYLPARGQVIFPEHIKHIVSRLSKPLPNDPVAEVQQQNQELLRLLDELHTSQAALEVVNRELAAANRDLEQFAYVASHDLQEPLRMVGSYLGLLQRRYGDTLDETAGQYIRYAVDGASRMSTLVRDLLELAQVQRMEIIKETVDGSLPLQDAIDNLKLSINEGGVLIDVGVLPALNIDRSLIAQVFQNLISNAIKFRRAISCTVRISATGDSQFHHIAIEDNGIGIPPDAFERIFEIFQRLHGVSEYPGSGIGLALCRRIVERHGGTTGVTSVLGEGSRFWFSVPKA
jgi:signal transduction histidine kinase